jgi:hypothetical protein
MGRKENSLRTLCTRGRNLDIMRHEINSVTFVVGTTGAVASKELWKVTGVIMATVIPICITDLTAGGAGTIALGNETVTNQFVAATTLTNIDAGELWLTNTPATTFAVSDTVPIWSIISGPDIGYTVGNADACTGGVIDFHLFWYPISEDAAVYKAKSNTTL